MVTNQINIYSLFIIITTADYYELNKCHVPVSVVCSKRKTTASSPAPDLFGRADSEDIDDLFQAAAETTPECRTETTPEHRTETEEDFLFTGTASSEADTGTENYFKHV